jgi:3-phenylpropionate/cinnamic acid dioxygenase small subunit
MNIELKLKVEDLNARYAQAIDDDKLECVAGLFIEQGRYRVTTAENFERGLPLGMIYAASRSMHSAPVASAFSNSRQTRIARQPPR